MGTASPSYKIQVNNGAIALHNTTDQNTWGRSYLNLTHRLAIFEDNVSRMVITNAGDVGIGDIYPATKLDLAGDGHFNGSLLVGANLTVNGNGVISNAAGGSRLKYYSRTANFRAVLGALGTSPEASIGFSGFTSAPQVMVGDIVSTGGTVGTLFRVQLVIYDVTASGCHCRLINTSNGPVNYDITWNIICICR